MDTFAEKLKSKLPSSQEILPVFSTIIFFVFSWSLYRTFWHIPSWADYLRIWELLVVTAYVLAFSLFESAIILGILLFLCLVLPSKYFKDKFVTQGSTVVFVISVGAFALQRKMSIVYDLDLRELIVYPTVILAVIIVFIFVSAYFFNRFKILTRFINAVADRMTVFALIYVPLSLLGLLVVVVRNIF